jgi:hypothetical protein
VDDFLQEREFRALMGVKNIHNLTPTELAEKLEKDNIIKILAKIDVETGRSVRSFDMQKNFDTQRRISRKDRSMKLYESKVLQEDPEVWNPNRINFAKLNEAIKKRGEYKKVVREKSKNHKAEAIRAFEKNKK